MQGLAQAAEKPPAQEQWKTMKKQYAEQWKQSEITGECPGPEAKVGNPQNVVHPSARPK